MAEPGTTTAARQPSRPHEPAALQPRASPLQRRVTGPSSAATINTGSLALFLAEEDELLRNEVRCAAEAELSKQNRKERRKQMRERRRNRRNFTKDYLSLIHI